MSEDEKTPRDVVEESREDGEVAGNEQAKLPGEGVQGDHEGTGGGDGEGTSAPGDGPTGGAVGGNTGGGTIAPGSGPSGGA